MDRVNESIRRQAQRNYSLLLRCLAQVSQKRVAELIGVSQPTLSEFKDEHLQKFAAIAAACGLKLAPVTAQTFDESYVSALKTLAAVGLGREPVRDDGGNSGFDEL